jgi:hypothetical protein
MGARCYREPKLTSWAQPQSTAADKHTHDCRRRGNMLCRSPPCLLCGAVPLHQHNIKWMPHHQPLPDAAAFNVQVIATATLHKSWTSMANFPTADRYTDTKMQYGSFMTPHPHPRVGNELFQVNVSSKEGTFCHQEPHDRNKSQTNHRSRRQLPRKERVQPQSDISSNEALCH